MSQVEGITAWVAARRSAWVAYVSTQTVITRGSLRPAVSEDGGGGEPIDILLKSTRDLLRPEQLVREATRDIVKEEIRHHLEKTLKEDPKLEQDLKDAVRALLEARALEYAALVKVGTCTARLGIAAVPPEIRTALTKDVVELISRELGHIVDRSL
jgi:hypothetical protein